MIVAGPEYVREVFGLRYKLESYARTRPRIRPSTRSRTSARLKKSRKAWKLSI